MKDVSIMMQCAHNNDHEPVFVLRARDNASERTLRKYAMLCTEMEDCPNDHIGDIWCIVQEFEDWRRAHPDKCKTPD